MEATKQEWKKSLKIQARKAGVSSAPIELDSSHIMYTS